MELYSHVLFSAYFLWFGFVSQEVADVLQLSAAGSLAISGGFQAPSVVVGPANSVVFPSRRSSGRVLLLVVVVSVPFLSDGL